MPYYGIDIWYVLLVVPALLFTEDETEAQGMSLP